MKPRLLTIGFFSFLSLATLAVAADSAASMHDRFGGIKTITAQPTGWFRIGQIGNRWYFITPEGHGFFSLAVTHAEDCVKMDERDQLNTKFGGDVGKLADFILKRLADWGYNSSGYGTLEAMEAKIPYVAEIWTEGPRSSVTRANSSNTDIFDPTVQERLRKTVQDVARRHANNPYCLGYVLIDLPIWAAIPMKGESYAHFVRALAPAASGRRAYHAFLHEKYAGKDAEFEKRYGIRLASVESGGFPPVSAASDAAVAADDQAFIGRMAAAYYACVVSALRSIDPHHLILGDRFMAFAERTPDSILTIAAKYVDVISFQPMGTTKPIAGYLTYVNRITGKPVLLADVNTMTMRPKKDMADSTEYERAAGQHTVTYYLEAASSHACIGIHRCTIRDYQPWNENYHRRGVLRADDTAYPILTDFTRQANQQVFNLVYSTPK